MCLVLSACGYTTSGLVYSGKKIVIVPVENKINITSQDRRYSTYTTSPILFEKNLTNVLISKFNSQARMRVVNKEEDALKLQCVILSYDKDAIRYTANEDVKEQRLNLRVKVDFSGSDGKIIKSQEVTGQTTYFLSGAYAKSESAALTDLIDDTARRIMELISEEW
jgi:hypothetical protein